MQPRIPDKLPEAVAAYLTMVDEIALLPDGLPALAATMIKQGRITLMLHRNWATFPDAIQREILAHEVGHIILEHHERRGDREPQRWNACIDAVLHHNRICDWEMVDKALGFTSATFERLDIPVTRAEIAYDLLGEKMPQCHNCGSVQVSLVDESVETLDRLAEVIMEVGPKLANVGGVGASCPHALTGTIPPVPKWIGKVLDRLLEAGGRSFRARSWRRPNRTGIDLLPGRGLRQSLDALFMLDASGSISDEQCLQFFAAVCSTPELRASQVIVFDSEPSKAIPVADGSGVKGAIEAKRGGTCIRRAGECRTSGVPVVWLTDGESGDGLPDPHNGLELWCVVGPTKLPGREVIRIED